MDLSTGRANSPKGRVILDLQLERMRDSIIADLIQQEQVRQTNGVELIASENYASNQVMEAQGSVLTNKYAEGLPGKRYYGGCAVVDQVEDIARQRLCTLFGAEWANVQPHSGANANSAVMLACLKPGDKIMGFDLAHGGHLTHGSPVNYSGKLYNPVFYGVEEETGIIDMDKVAETAEREQPKLLICGASAYSRDWDYARFPPNRRQRRGFVVGGHQPPCGIDRCRFAQGSYAALSHCDLHHAQDAARATRRDHHGRQGHGKPLGIDHPKRRGTQAVVLAG